MRRLKNRCGQSTLEYAILIAVVVGGLLAMQTYVKRGIQGRLRDSADDIGSQYSPGNVTSRFTTTTRSRTVEEVRDGETTSELIYSLQERDGWEKVAPLKKEYWPD